MSLQRESEKQQIYEAIYEVVRSIPKGRVISYGAIANAIGLKSGARMVARAMSLDTGTRSAIPAQRVVSSSGELSGDHGLRAKLLEQEGLQIKNNKVVDFKQFFWDPLYEINI